MTMSVGLGRIINDPTASVLTRKALGTLSTPGLLVHDTGLSIDDEGRLYIKLNPDGGLQQDENGLALTPEPITFGIDSVVNLGSVEHDRSWNAYITGSAPSYFESGVAIGAETFEAISPTAGVELDKATFNVTSNQVQIRASYDTENVMSVRVLDNGTAEFFSVGSSPGFHLISGDGTYQENPSGGLTINNGTTVEQIIAFRANLGFPGGGVIGAVSWGEISVTASVYSSDFDLRPTSDVVVAVPADGTAIPAQMISHSARVGGTNSLTVRIAWFDIMGPFVSDWIFLVHRLLA